MSGPADDGSSEARAAGRGDQAPGAPSPVAPQAGADVPGGAAPDVPAGVDVARRRFFRQFGREAMTTAAGVAGALGALRRGTMAASTELLGLGMGDPVLAARRLEANAERSSGGGVGGFHSPYRFTADRLLILDQRRLPEAFEEIECTSAGDVVEAMRELAVRGPVLAQVAAYALALAARRSRSGSTYARNAILRGGARALETARPSSLAVARAVGRMLDRWYAVGEHGEGEAVAAALRQEADAIASEAMLDHAALSRAGAALLPDPPDRPLRVLAHGATGPLAGGLVGTGLAVVQQLASMGRELDVWLTEGGPAREGARLAAWELAQLDVASTIVPDSGIGWLLERETPDAVLLGADGVAANGDTVNLAGSYPLALLAARHGVPLYVCTALSAVDPDSPTGQSLPADERPSDEVPLRLPPVAELRVPISDVTPGDLVTAFVTEEGVLRPAYSDSLPAAVEARAKRRATEAGAAG